MINFIKKTLNGLLVIKLGQFTEEQLDTVLRKILMAKKLLVTGKKTKNCRMNSSFASNKVFIG